jgi:uncharacterized protein (TIGR04255 family)
MSVDEVYPNAPLALVAAEVRFPAVTERPLSMAVQRQLRDTLGSDWVIHPDKAQTFEAAVGPGGPQASVRTETFSRITSRQRSKIVTVKPDNFTIEVVDYVHFAEFSELLATVSDAVERVLRPDGISRVGLRYINEISVPGPIPNWAMWLHPSVMAPVLPPTLTPTDWTGAVQYQVESDCVLVLRYGPAIGPVVSPNGPLRRPRVVDGPIFVLDFDSSWQPSDIPKFNASSVSDAGTKLRGPIRNLFDSLIKPDLLAVFRQEPKQ